MDLGIFKAYDVRGIYPTQIDEDAAYKVGRALVRFLMAKQVVVGRDMRTSSPALSAKLIEGIVCEGADVIDVGECTTPMMNFAVSAYDYDGGVMVTASHSPGDNNGLKLVSAKDGMIDESAGLDKIREMVEGGFSKCQTCGTMTKKDVLPDYVSHVLSAVGEVANLKIVLDYGNGMGAVSAKPALSRLDVEIIEMFDEPDGRFPNHEANPHDVKNFTDLQKKVITEKADFGVFFDGDADRALFVDEKGQIVPIDLLTTILAKEELLQKPGEKVYYDLRFSKAVPDVIKKAGGMPVMLRVGNPFYKRALKYGGGILGAEFSGHIMYAENYRIDDGLYAALKVINMLSKEVKKLSVLIEEVREYEGSDEESFEAPHPDTVRSRLIAAFSDARLVELDGTYLDFDDGFISVRQSQTETQLFRMRVEAKTKDVLEKRLEKTRQIILG